MARQRLAKRIQIIKTRWFIAFVLYIIIIIITAAVLLILKSPWTGRYMYLLCDTWFLPGKQRLLQNIFYTTVVDTTYAVIIFIYNSLFGLIITIERVITHILYLLHSHIYCTRHKWLKINVVVQKSKNL